MKSDDAVKSSSIRSVLHSAYTLVRSTETNKAFSGFTLDHAIQEQINYLKKGERRAFVDGRGESLGNRTSRWDQLDALENDISQVVSAIKAAGNDKDKLSNLGIFETDLEETP